MTQATGPVPLTWATRSMAIEIVNSVFPRQRWWENAGLGLSLSLLPTWLGRAPLLFARVKNCRCWTMLQDDQVAGVTGIYQRFADSPRHGWLGWTCTSDSFRGHGIGSTLIDFAIEEARRIGFRRLNVYSTREYQLAIEMYRRRGFIETGNPGKIRYSTRNSDLVFLSLSLQGHSLPLVTEPSVC